MPMARMSMPQGSGQDSKAGGPLGSDLLIRWVKAFW